MKMILQFCQAMGMLLVGIGLFHGLFDNDPTQGMWSELWYLLAGAGMFYLATLLLRKYK